MVSDEIRSAAAKRLGVSADNGQIKLDRTSLLEGMGGWLGIVEAIVPSVLFGASFAITRDGLLSVILAVSTSLLFILYRVFRRKSASSAVVGGLTVGFAAWLALREGGQTVDYFIPGFITNASYGSVLLISILIRWPLIGVLVELLRGHGMNWRKERKTLTVYSLVTALWVAFFSLRLAVQLPLYFSGSIELLATARIVMGPPLYALIILSTWLILRATVLKPR